MIEHKSDRISWEQQELE